MTLFVDFPFVKQIGIFTYILFPKEFKIQTFLKTHLHECYPILPMINISKIKNIN